MSGPLVSNQMRTFLRSQVRRQFIDTVTIQNKLIADDDYGMSATYSSTSVTDGWLRETNNPVLSERAGGNIAAPGVYRLFLPHDTVVGTGDRVLIGGQAYEVQGTNAQDTNLISLVVTVRRLETE